MSKFKVGDRVRRLPQYRNQGGWDRGDDVMTVVRFSPVGWLNGWLILHDYPHGGSAAVCPLHFELVHSPMLARDELYMRLLKDAKVSHEAALEFIAACPNAGVIRRELDSCNTGDAMLRLVVFFGTPRGHSFWFDAALRGGALRGGAAA